MDGNWIEVIVILLAIVGSNVWLHRDIANLREGMARLEGLFEGFTGSRSKETAQ